MKRSKSQQLLDRISYLHKQYRRELTKRIGKRLEQIRTEKKVSRAELARRTSLGTETLTSYENGTLDSISCSSLYMLASELDADLSWLISGNGNFNFMQYMNQGYGTAQLKAEIEDALNDEDLSASARKRFSNFLEQLSTPKTPSSINPYDNPANIIKNDDKSSLNNHHSTGLIFAIQDQFHKFSLSLQTVLDCLKIAESSGCIAKLSPEWWCSVINHNDPKISIKINNPKE
ncbi:helix-turn-helix transcriptional regulator [Maridesulfovibrio sp.]|uniref:helix-turn-helix domain-containing protein n=1 Tax=Maridesulfovibrio sp. TaxID=2795000 RepID=UPI0029F46781|nr:helix-turn-helix transcriptional regulator [Maridesulfovibrio sp.]